MSLAKFLSMAAITLAVSTTFAEGHEPRALASPFKGTIDFTVSEVQNHRFGLPALITTANKRTEEFHAIQTGWLDSCGIGLLYGYLSPYSKLTTAEREAYIKTNATCATPPKVGEVGVTSCEIFVTKYLQRGFEEISQASVYKRINKFLTDNDRDGLALAFALRKLGWKIVYWNTDANVTPPLPEDRKIMGQTPADHVWSTKLALNKREYYGVPIDAVMINFAPQKGSKTKKDTSAYARLADVPYYVGISHAGFHVWQGSYGNVTESHSFWDPTDRHNIEVGSFAPPLESPTGRTIEYQGKRQTFFYYAGIIAIPPGSWVWF
ncbi:MAG: hypothetical protein V4760_10785 [Bdellovibrionota bacterium]